MKAEGVQRGRVVQTKGATPQRSLQHFMSIHISVESIQGKQRKDIIQEIQQRAKKEALLVIKEVFEAGLEAEVEDLLGRKKGATRWISSHPRQRAWKCGHCGCQDANQFLRDGHYKRNAGDGMGAYRGIACSHAGMSTVFS